MSEHSMSNSEVTVSDDDTYRNHLDFYTVASTSSWQACTYRNRLDVYTCKMSNNVLITFILCVNISVLSKYATIIHL